LKFTVTIELDPSRIATTRDLADALNNVGTLVSDSHRSLNQRESFPAVLRNDCDQRIGFWRFHK